MKRSLKYYSFPGSQQTSAILRKKVILFFLILLAVNVKSQSFANFVNNGSFEDIYNCAGPSYPLSVSKYWLSIDSASYGGQYASTCYSAVPLNANAYQYPRSGDSYIISTMFYFGGIRGYLKNRLKANLKSGKTYCVKFHVNISNMSPYGMNGFGAYFGDNTIDTITQCNTPLSYLNPLIKNPLGNVISDTLNWVPITGTFVANGTEKYALLGNFLADNAVTTASIGGPYYPQLWTDVLIDDVSCIDIDLPAYAGPNKPFIPGDSLYIGRESDTEIDESCIWYKMTSPTTSVTIDTIAGMWVKPIATTTYVVSQQLWCSGVKWDTVVVYVDAVGLKGVEYFEQYISLFPNPAADFIQIEYSLELSDPNMEVSVYNQLGQFIFQDNISFKNRKSSLPIYNLDVGVYSIELRCISGQTVKKRFVVSR